jgi:DNA polymerase-3 subunit gamma/tau
VREVLTRFPGAEIVDVRETASEALPAAEEAILGEGDAARADEAPDDDF